MTAKHAESPCPRCGSPASGRFCASCGAALEGAACPACGKPLTAGSRFCHHCGAPLAAAAVAAGVTPGGGKMALGWLVPGVAVLALVAFLIGQRVARGSSDASAADAGASRAAPFGGGGRAPDISAMSPQERADRLFDRLMTYGEKGKLDSARIFAPMAIQAYEMLGTLDAHNRYDIGMIAVVTADAARARAQADTILAASPTHLLGLILAMKAAGLRNDAVARATFEKRFRAAERAELAKKLREYDDHRPDIDAAQKAAGRG